MTENKKIITTTRKKTSLLIARIPHAPRTYEYSNVFFSFHRRFKAYLFYTLFRYSLCARAKQTIQPRLLLLQPPPLYFSVSHTFAISYEGEKKNIYKIHVEIICVVFVMYTNLYLYLDFSF